MAGRRQIFLALVGCVAVTWLGCTQTVQIVVGPEPLQFTVEPGKAELDRRYDMGGQKRVFVSGAQVSFDKGTPPTIVVVDKSGVPLWKETLVKYPMRWYEVVLTPLFGLGYVIWEPYADPYSVTVKGAADARLVELADTMAADILTHLPADAKKVGIFYIETDVVEKGQSQPYVSEGNRRLSEYMCNALRRKTAALDLREYKLGVSWYFKHTPDSLGESVEARRQLIIGFAQREKLDVAVYAKNYQYPALFSKERGTRNNCRLEFDVLSVKGAGTITKFEHTLTMDPKETDLVACFWPTEPPAAGVAPPIEVVLERTATHLARDLLEKMNEGTLLASYDKPIATFVTDFGYVVATPTNERVVLPNKYGAYVAEKVAQGLMAGSGGKFVFVARKKLQDAFGEMKDVEKRVLVDETSAWIDPDTAPKLGGKVGARMIFFGRMEQIGGDLNITVELKDIERGVILCSVEEKITLDQFLQKQLEAGTLSTQKSAP